MTDRPVLFFDLGSPYAYLACERAASVLGVAPDLCPIVLGPIFAVRGFDSWGRGEGRAENTAEVERRARVYGLPPMAWPAQWPVNTLHAMRMAVWAVERGRGAAFARAAFRAGFVDGADLRDHAVLARCAGAAGFPGVDVAAVVADPAIKAALRRNTDAAIVAGVRGVPTVAVAGRLVYGDDRLVEAAAG